MVFLTLMEKRNFAILSTTEMNRVCTTLNEESFSCRPLQVNFKGVVMLVN